ncbi:MAG: hypothetical protein K0S47_3758 [Herbinix sp.]|jgi:V/A-type H+-transporting ATPase subunit C|nr:hypothetical protein [Herbinix sp.]
MSFSLSYSGINTKVRAMDSKLISLEDYKKISTLETVVDFIAFLKNHPGYKDIFQKYDERELHRGEAERMFIYGFYTDFTKIYRFANGFQRKDLALLFFRYEVNVLKSLLRSMYNSESTNDLSLFLPFFKKHSQINVEVLATSRTMEEYIQNLKGTEYYPLFVKIQSGANATSFDYEMQLDIYYFKKAWKLKESQLTSVSRKAFTHRFGTEIDLLNIIWIYRSKKMYDLNAGDILAYLIPINYKLSKDQLMKLAGTASIEEFSSVLSSTYYKAIYQHLADGTIETDYKHIIQKIFQVHTTKYPASMTTVNYYLYRKELEISQLTTALECIRYGLDPKDKLKYILQ